MVIRRYVCFMMYHLCKNERKVLSNYHNNRINNFNNMKKKNLLFVAAAMVMAGCASDDMIGDNTATQSDNQVIGFNMNMPAVTRADQTGTPAATALGNEFIVWGEKNEPTDGTACASTDLVFKNYRVHYQANSANTTTSNTKDWEYVGITPYHEDGTGPTTTGQGTESTAYVYPSMYSTNTPTQTIKYWELNKKYTFTAVSAAQQDIKDGKVTITKTTATSETSGGSPKDKGYTIVLKNGADASKIYVAERLEDVERTTAPATGKTMDAVSLKFRNFQTKIRFGFYETVPGYNVKITKVAYGNTTSETSNKFGVTGNFVQVPTGTADTETLTYAVTYDTKNIPVVSITTTSTATKGYEEFGNNIFSFSANIGKSSLESDITYDKADKKYTSILPNTGNETPMTFTVSYDLISEDTGEKIAVADRQVTVPAAYCQWKPNFAYTYLFKISDKSTELYPITFDAVVAEDEVNLQKTITEVAGETTNKVSITTLGVTEGKFSADADEYKTGSTIYASAMEWDATNSKYVAASLSATNVKLYTVTSTNSTQGGAVQEITEGSVANCIANGGDADTKTVKDLNGCVMTATPVTSGLEYPTAVPAEDGGEDRTLSALKWTAGTSGTYYAVEYIKTKDAQGQDLSTPLKYYKIVKIQ